MKERYHAAEAYAARGHATYQFRYPLPFSPLPFPWVFSPVPVNVSDRQWCLRGVEQDAANAERAQSFSVVMRVLQ